MDGASEVGASEVGGRWDHGTPGRRDPMNPHVGVALQARRRGTAGKSGPAGGVLDLSQGVKRPTGAKPPVGVGGPCTRKGQPCSGWWLRDPSGAGWCLGRDPEVSARRSFTPG